MKRKYSTLNPTEKREYVERAKENKQKRKENKRKSHDDLIPKAQKISCDTNGQILFIYLVFIFCLPKNLNNGINAARTF